MVTNELFTLKRAGVRWGLLMCLCHTLRSQRLKVPQSVDGKLQVARSKIECGCAGIREVEVFLDDVETTIVEETSYKRIESVNLWMQLLEKTKKHLPDKREIMEIPFMDEVIQKYEFLHYCLPP